MRRFYAVLSCVLICLLLSSCASVPYDGVFAASQATRDLQKYSANYYIEVTLADGSITLLYLNGSYSVDREKGLVMRDSSQTYLGDAWHETEYYDGEMLYNAEGDDRYKLACSLGEVLQQSVYALAPVIPEEKVFHLSASDNSAGRMYRFEARDMSQFQFDTVGDSIYTLAALRKPQKELTEYTDVRCEYTVGEVDGTECLSTWQIEYGMSLFDTPPYAAGTKQDIDDYRLDISVRLRVKLTSVGESFSLPAIDKDLYDVVE